METLGVDLGTTNTVAALGRQVLATGVASYVAFGVREVAAAAGTGSRTEGEGTVALCGPG